MTDTQKRMLVGLLVSGWGLFALLGGLVSLALSWPETGTMLKPESLLFFLSPVLVIGGLGLLRGARSWTTRFHPPAAIILLTFGIWSVGQLGAPISGFCQIVLGLAALRISRSTVGTGPSEQAG